MQIAASSFMTPGMQPGWPNSQPQGTTLPGQATAQEESATGRPGQLQPDKTQPGKTQAESADQPKDPSGQQLSEEDKLKVAELKKIDANVKAHEAAHMSAGGGLVRGGASYEYQSGPDGQRYAVAGEVSIDTSAVRGNPQATLAKAQRIRQAALAPADPSSQDRSVAAQASQMAAEASMELAKERSENAQSGQAGSTSATTGNQSGKDQQQEQQFMHFLASNNQHFKPSPGSLLNLNA
jgi:hypothetical protein